MSDKELIKAFGLSEEEIEREVSAVESGDFSGYDFSQIIEGRPIEKEKMDMLTASVPHSRMVAMNKAAKKQGISRAEWLRRAIDNELLACS